MISGLRVRVLCGSSEAQGRPIGHKSLGRLMGLHATGYLAPRVCEAESPLPFTGVLDSLRPRATIRTSEYRRLSFPGRHLQCCSAEWKGVHADTKGPFFASRTARSFFCAPPGQLQRSWVPQLPWLDDRNGEIAAALPSLESLPTASKESSGWTASVL